jgi:hypothetical protein
MIYVLKIIWDYRVPLLELIIRNIVRYPQSATLMSIRYQPAIRYLLPWVYLICEVTQCIVSSSHKFWWTNLFLIHILIIYLWGMRWWWINLFHKMDGPPIKGRRICMRCGRGKLDRSPSEECSLLGREESSVASPEGKGRMGASAY